MFQKLHAKRERGEGGFTLIELLVVMVIIGVLAAIAIPLFQSQKGQFREAALKNDLRNLATYAESYGVAHAGSYSGFDVAAAQADGFKYSDSYIAGEVKPTITVSATDFCLDGSANGNQWTFDSKRSAVADPQLMKAACS